MKSQHGHMALKTRLIHFVGIGGVGMSGIAEVLLNLGYAVRGSDQKSSDSTARLISLGGDVRIGHDKHHVDGADVVVVSSAIHAHHPEIERAKHLKIPVIRRAEMLAELMRFKVGVAVGGTHGKTTTTSLIATILEGAHLDPTVVVGGKLNQIGTNAKLGLGQYMVAEADESDASFLHLTPTIAIVTNIDPEHLDHYKGGISEILDAFATFINRIPFYGLAVLCLDSPYVRSILPRIERRTITYGLHPEADVQAKSISLFGVSSTFQLLRRGHIVGEVNLPMMGEHNVRNALAAFCVADELQVPFSTYQEAISSFKGVDRRFTIRGELDGVLVVDDYGHHPEEIRATLKGARHSFSNRRIRVIFQPHRFTRTRDLLPDFATAFQDADDVYILPIYAAGEAAIEGISSEELARSIKKATPALVVEAALDIETAIGRIVDEHQGNDLVITLGAGDVTKASHQVLSRLHLQQATGDST